MEEQGCRRPWMCLDVVQQKGGVDGRRVVAYLTLIAVRVRSTEMTVNLDTRGRSELTA
jgi:hypothetical protein